MFAVGPGFVYRFARLLGSSTFGIRAREGGAGTLAGACAAARLHVSGIEREIGEQDGSAG